MKKRRKASPDSDGVDRISRLPDSLIHHIMSFNDTKCAVQTCILSKRWINVWKTLPFLSFDRSSFAKKKKHSFIMFVDMVFLLRGEFDLQKFNMCWEDSAYDIAVPLNVNRWCLNAAVKHNVQEIVIEITQCHKSPIEIPHHVLNCKSLRKLAIKMIGKGRYVDIILPRSMNLPQLKVLSLYGLSISGVELSKTLFSSCPILETLSILGCDIQTDHQKNLIVDSLSLVKFSYNCWHRHTVPNIIKLNAPNLEDFNCKSFMTEDFSLEICSPLSGVTLNMVLEGEEEDENPETYEKLPLGEKAVYATRMMKFLGAVYMVKDMRLSSGFLEVLSQAPDLLDCQPPLFCNLTNLTLEMWSTRGCMRAIAYLLSIFPNITNFFLESKESKLSDVGDDWEAGLSSPRMLSHLQYVQIEEVEGCDAELKLLTFLLKNAEVLEEVVLYFHYSVGSPDRMRHIEQFKDKIRAVATASSSVLLSFY